ncbi:MAG: alpha/beta fold hydrolase [Nocardioides sp.]
MASLTSATPEEPAVAVSAELVAPVERGIELCYQTFGNPADEPMLLVMGLGGPMTWWDPELCSMLAREGFFVIRFDNRDTGRSSKLHDRVTRAQLVRAFAGRANRAPYALVDLAHDAFGLLDHLGLESAHLVGVSMGGMIVQTMAVGRPSRVRSLTSIMSSTGKRSVGWQHPKLLPVLIAPRRPGRAAYVASSRRVFRLIGSPDYPQDPADQQAEAEETFDRGFSAGGVQRQMLAILTQPNRTPALHGLRMPALVIHGLADPMVHPSGGRATAAAIPGAELLLIDGMGHDLPRQLYRTFADAIVTVAHR